MFAYGTLQIAAVLETLIGRIPPTTPTNLPGWRAVRLHGKPYPGLVRDTSHAAPGLLLTDLTNEEWSLLDRFEDTIYSLERVTTADRTDAWAYAWPNDFEDADWLLNEFERNELPSYITRCSAWLERDRNRR
nr:gamma-glutamylcyclotransferase family protein [Nocardia bovistercoris]